MQHRPTTITTKEVVQTHFRGGAQWAISNKKNVTKNLKYIDFIFVLFFTNFDDFFHICSLHLARYNFKDHQWSKNVILSLILATVRSVWQ